MPTAYIPQPWDAKRATVAEPIVAVCLPVAVEVDHRREVLEAVPGVQALGRHLQDQQRRGDEEQAGGQGHVHGLRHIEAAPSDLLAALDQQRRCAHHEGDQRQPGEISSRSTPGTVVGRRR